MKKIKNTIAIVLTIILAASISACGAKIDPPETVVDKALTALKASDFDTAAMYFDTDIGASIGKNTADNENSNEIHNEDINNQIIQILMDNLQYTIVSSEESDDTAVVTVKIKNINMADVMQDYLSEALNYVFSDISADELETKLNELLISSMDKNTENLVENEVDLILNKTETGWIIAVDTSFVDAITGGTATMAESFESSLIADE